MSRSLSLCLIILSALRPSAGARALSDLEALFQTDIQVKGPSLSPGTVPADGAATAAPATPGIHTEVSTTGVRAGSAKAFGWWRGFEGDTFFDKADTLFVICCLVIGTVLALPVVIVRMVYHFCRSMNKGFLGLNIEIGGVSVNLPRGRIRIDMLMLHNPVSHYNTPYLVKVGKVNVDISLKTLLVSFFRDIRIQSAKFADVDINYEKAWGTSNVQVVANMIREKKQHAPLKLPPNPLRLELHRVTLENVTAKVQNQNFMGRGSRMSVGTIHYTDFLLETGKSQIDDVGKVLLMLVLQTVMKSICDNALGEPLAL